MNQPRANHRIDFVVSDLDTIWLRKRGADQATADEAAYYQEIQSGNYPYQELYFPEIHRILNVSSSLNKVYNTETGESREQVEHLIFMDFLEGYAPLSRLILGQKLDYMDLNYLWWQYHGFNGRQAPVESKDLDQAWATLEARYNGKFWERVKYAEGLNYWPTIPLSAFSYIADTVEHYYIDGWDKTLCPTHNDLVLSNVLFNRDAERPVRFIDPKIWSPYTGILGDPRYDHAKIAQCLWGYDFAVADIEIPWDYLDKLRAEYYACREYTPEKIEAETALVAMLYINLLPAHYDDPARQMRFLGIFDRIWATL